MSNVSDYALLLVTDFLTAIVFIRKIHLFFMQYTGVGYSLC